MADEKSRAPRVTISRSPGLSMSAKSQEALDQLMAELQAEDIAVDLAGGCENYVECKRYNTEALA